MATANRIPVPVLIIIGLLSLLTITALAVTTLRQRKTVELSVVQPTPSAEPEVVDVATLIATPSATPTALPTLPSSEDDDSRPYLENFSFGIGFEYNRERWEVKTNSESQILLRPVHNIYDYYISIDLEREPKTGPLQDFTLDEYITQKMRPSFPDYQKKAYKFKNSNITAYNLVVPWPGVMNVIVYEKDGYFYDYTLVIGGEVTGINPSQEPSAKQNQADFFALLDTLEFLE